MPKAKDARADKAFEMYKQGLKLIEIANQLGIAEGTVRSWKNRYKWDDGGNATLRKKEKKECNVAKENKQAKKAKKEPVAHEVEAVIQNTDLTDKQQLFAYITSDALMRPRHTRKRMDVIIQRLW